MANERPVLTVHLDLTPDQAQVRSRLVVPFRGETPIHQTPLADIGAGFEHRGERGLRAIQAVLDSGTEADLLGKLSSGRLGDVGDMLYQTLDPLLRGLP